MATLYPLDCNNLASEEAIMPFPNEEATPPVTNTYFVDTIFVLKDKHQSRKDKKLMQKAEKAE